MPVATDYKKATQMSGFFMLKSETKKALPPERP